MKRFQIVSVVALALSLSACADWMNKDKEEENPFKGMTAKQLYTASQQELKKKQYNSAAQRLEAIETMYPFSNYAQRSQMKLIYAYYNSEDYPSAAATAERFIHLYPRAKHVDYAYYMKGMSNFKQNRGALARILALDESERDPGSQTQAYLDFSTLVQRFPESRYKPNALQHMIYLRNMLAKYELNVSNYYFKRKMYVAAIERSNFLIKNYSQAPSTKEALVVLYHANKALGFNDAAQDAMTVYQANYHTNVMQPIRYS